MKNNLTYILLGVGAGLGVYYIMCNRFKKNMTQQEPMSNASGRPIGANPCGSSNEASCQQNCENMGGTYNQNGDRRCYKNGRPISGGFFGNSIAKRQMR